MDNTDVIVIGGGIAGMEAAIKLNDIGHTVTILEKKNYLGGNLAGWNHLFPDYKPAQNFINNLRMVVGHKVKTVFNADISKVDKNGGFNVTLTDGNKYSSKALLLTTGFNLFNARKKEEYGYGIYNNVINSADLEEIFKNDQPFVTAMGDVPKKVAFIHCVGSRDQKVGNLYCSKVCCMTAVKQAIEIKKKYPQTEVFNFYMDLRMFDKYFEELYLEAQFKYHVNFIRGRLSEAFENTNGSLLLKVEDTLSSRPLKLTVDLMVLMVGMEPAKESKQLSEWLDVELSSDSFFTVSDINYLSNNTRKSGVFVAGAASGPKSVRETINDARSVVLAINEYLHFA